MVTMAYPYITKGKDLLFTWALAKLKPAGLVLMTHRWSHGTWTWKIGDTERGRER